MSDERTLRERARDAIRSGALPGTLPERTWGGPGGGDPCAICGAVLSAGEVEIEVELDDPDDERSGRELHLHPRCFAAWQSECRALRRRPAASAGSTEREAPEEG